MSLHSVILAAGEGRRFGGIKPLARFYSNTFIERAFHLAEAVTPGKVSVVLGANANAILGVLPKSIAQECCIHPHWQKGLGHSIGFGVKQLPESATGVLLLLCDQVAVNEQDLQTLCGAYVHEPTPQLVAAAYAGQVGVPAIFSKHFFNELTQLSGDVGAKKILARSSCRTVAMPSAQYDVDTQEDLRTITTKLCELA